MKINPEMIVLARKLRGMTQIELSRAIGQGQARISKLEGGLQPEVSESIVELLCTALKVPVSFLTQDDELLAVGSSAYYYRKKAELSAADRDRIHAIVNLYRIHLKKQLESVEISVTKPLPQFNIDDFGGSAQKAAQALRAVWMLPDGPVKNLTALLESAGIVIFPCDFGTKAMDATAMRIADMPPMIFINKNISADRWRFTIAHELAHLVLHDTPHPFMEDEADSFAAEFLLPEIELRGHFQRMVPVRLEELATLKPYWKVSMAALLMRAGDLGFINPVQKSRLWARMSQLGWRTKEPNSIPYETPTTLIKIAKYFTEQLNYTKMDLIQLFKINEDDFLQLHGASFGMEPEKLKPQLRIV